MAVIINKTRTFLIFLATAVISLTTFLVIETEASSRRGHMIAIAAAIAVIAVGIGLYIAELRALKKNKAIKESVESGEYFSSQNWRQAYLNFKAGYEFARPDPRGMRADILKRYRNLPTYGYFLFFFAIAVVFTCIIMPHPVKNMTMFRFTMLSGGILCSADGVRRLLGIPARRWMKRIRNEYHDVESSYNSGKMVRELTSGINIGTHYIVIYNESKVVSFRTPDIIDAGRTVVRENQYAEGVYYQTEQKYKVWFAVADEAGNKNIYDIELGLFESQLVCDEVRELLRKRDELTTGFEETDRNDMPTIT